MKFHSPERTPRQRLRSIRWGKFVLIFFLLFTAVVFQSSQPQPPAQAAINASDITITAYDQETGNPVADGFRYIINEDIANDNASINNPRSYSPLIAVGDDASPTVSLDPGKYVVTVLGGPFPAVPGDPGRDCEMDDPCGYKLGGEHFTVDESGTPLTIQVDLVPNPLPLATLRVRVFHDNNSLDQEDNIPIELGIPDMPIVISDPTGEVTVDFFGNPICTQYDGVGSSTPLGDPVPGTGGQCLTGSDGYAVIPNIPPLKYEVEVVPPDGSGWIQTTTIEGTHAIDAWLEEGASGYSTEVGFLTAAVWFGFVKECSFGDTSDTCPTNDIIPANAGSITGRVRQLTIDTDAPGAGALGPTVYRPYIGLNNISGNDEQVYTARGEADGTFTIPNVPPGLYQLVYWDFPQLYIISFATVQVGDGEHVDIGDIGLPRWRGTIMGYAYIDSGVARNGTPIPDGPFGPSAGNGIRDCLAAASGPHDWPNCEPGLPGQDLDIRHKDGTIQYATFADGNGFYSFPDYFEWEHFLIWEIGFGRFKQVGTTSYFAGFSPDGLTVEPIGYPYNPENGPVEGLGGLLQAQLTWAGTYQWIDTGKLPYAPGENGGISGIVYYATTRNEYDPRYAAAEDYEPGIPGVTINVFGAALDNSGSPIACAAVGPGCPYGQGELMRMSDTPLDSVQTDAWDDGNHPTDCTYETPVPGSGVFATDPLCLELPRTWNQIKDGVFDGGYAFEGLPAGMYIVEVVEPPGYHQIREEDQNTDQGDFFVPATPPPPCAGPLHLVNDTRNPADGTMTPLCDSKLVNLVEGFNAPAEFYLMTDNAVPPPGMIRGLLVDDLILQLDPGSPLYVEKRGIPNTPIGILDFQNNEIARVYSDQDGYWEVTLPSTYTAHCPTPGGVCPGMYRVVGNYPGDPRNPDPLWNPQYGTLHLVFDVWPGRTTYADVALLPTTNLIPDPVGGFVSVICEVPADTPELRAVSQAYGSAGDSITITGDGFGTSQGSVILDGAPMTIIAWSDTQIVASIPAIGAGPYQLDVVNAAGNASTIGLTLHVLGAGYNPPLIFVDDDAAEGGNGSLASPYNTIEAALNASADGDLIIVQDGVYYETLILTENVKLQGHGPGSTVIDGRFFNFGGMSPQQFLDKVAATAYDGPADVPMGQVLTVLAEDGEFSAGYTTQIDGFAIRHGSVVRGNVPVVATQQGGAIYVHAYARNLEISNNLAQTNSGLTGGGIILGHAYTPNPDAGGALDSENDNVRIHNNHVLNNGGVTLAGGVAIFNGASDYEIDNNLICGNYSAEYGGGISHFGLSPGGSIHDNTVTYNYAFDEGGGIMIAGELANDPNAVSPGSGDVLIERNLVQANNSNDDGGGIRLLQPVAGPISIINNMVVNNLATDAGGGVSMDDALDVRIINNTIAKNISTATAEDADRSTCNPPPLGSCPHAAGVHAEGHSQALRNAFSLPADSFSDPRMFNNIIWENEAFYLDGTGGVLPALPSGFIDLEVVGTISPQTMTPNYSVLTEVYGSGVGNIVGMDPLFVEEMDLQYTITPFAGDPAFIVVLITTQPSDPQGDYHLQENSVSIDTGTPAFGGASAPSDDFDSEPRPRGPGYDIGADELPVALYFSTASDTPIPGVPGPYDGGDVYRWDGASFSRIFDASAAGLAINIDALLVVDPDTFYFSLTTDGLFGDEDILYYDNGTISLFFDGSDLGLTTGNHDVDAFDILPDGSVVVSIVGPAANVPGLIGAVQDEDLLRCVGSFGTTTTCTWSVYFDGSDVSLNNGVVENVDGTDFYLGNIYLSTSGNFGVSGLSGDGSDIFTCNSPGTGADTSCASFSMFFDGSAQGVAGSLDAFSLRAEPMLGQLLGLFIVNANGSAITPSAGLAVYDDYDPATPGEPVTLIAAGLTSSDQIYAWDFGDGTTGSGRVVEHVFDEIANYRVTVTASSPKGSVTTESTIQVGWRTYIPLVIGSR